MDEATVAMNIFREAEDEGSELAVIFQAIYYDEAKDKTGQEECLTRIAENIRSLICYLENRMS